MRDVTICLAFLLAFVLSFCGGPQFVADLLKPNLGQVGVWAAFAPLMIAGVGAFSFLDLSPVPADLVMERSRWHSFTVRAGVASMLLLILMNSFTLWHLAVVADHPNPSLIVAGSIVGMLLAAVYVRLALRYRRLPLQPAYRSYRCLAPRQTAGFVLSESEAYLALSAERRPSGPNGEFRIAFILHTQDAGASWTQLPCRRSLWSWVRHPFAQWPPEDIVSIEHTPQGLRITYWEELLRAGRRSALAEHVR